MGQTPTGAPRFRIKYLLFPKFQLMLVVANLAVIVSTFLVMGVMLSNAFSELGQAAGLSGVEAEFYRKYLSYQSQRLEIAFGVAFLLGVSLCTLMTLIISHKFSGPLIRLRGYFKTICEGAQPIPRLKFRKGDFLGDIPPLVNQALDTIQDRSDRGAGQKPTHRAS